MPLTIRKPYDPSSHAGAIDFGDEVSRTKQSEMAGCDLNLLMAQYLRGGDITHVAKTMPLYGDFSNVPDFKAALDQVNEAHELFMEMSANVRSRMDNDPQKLIEFLADPANQKEGEDLGLYERRAEAVTEEGAAEVPAEVRESDSESAA